LLHHVIKGNAEQVLELLSSGVDPDFYDSYHFTPLLHAARESNRSDSYLLICELLLECGANPNASNRNGESPLLFACYRGRIDMVKLLLEKGAYTNARTTGGYLPHQVTSRADIKELLSAYRSNHPIHLSSSAPAGDSR